MRALELFCGIGGFAAAADESDIEIIQAIDINQLSVEVYQHNAGRWQRTPSAGVGRRIVSTATLESIAPEALADYRADLWWLSPPCQPFTSRGHQRDIHDRRCAPLLHLIGALKVAEPRFLMLENVAPFCRSQAADKLRSELTRLGYQFVETLICPSWLGIANRRLRYYLLASRVGGLNEPIFFGQSISDWESRLTWPTAPGLSLETSNRPISIGDDGAERSQHRPAMSATTQRRAVPEHRRIPDVLIEENWRDPSLLIPSTILETYASAINSIDSDDPTEVSACFTSAYGSSPVYSGSFLRRGDLSRYFCPLEMAKLLGFSDSFCFPTTLTRKQCWALAGNSLSIDVVRALLQVVKSI